MTRRGYLLAGLAAVALAVVLLVGIVAATGMFGRGVTAGPPGGAVAGSCQVPAALPGQRVNVVLADMGGMRGSPGGWMGGRMMLGAAPHTVRAGAVSFVAVNHGVRTHELLVLPLSAGRPVGARPVGPDNTVEETGSLGEASRGCGAGHGDGIAPGQAGWVTLSLAPGRYELLCNLPGHYAAGMFTDLDVAG
jgi:uncharacterized cupredoxin-like copper-binding protein